MSNEIDKAKKDSIYFSPTSIKMKEHPRIEFASDENIDEFAYELIERIFEIEGALLTDESTLDDFKPIDYIPGHWQRRLSDIPESERDLYLKEMPDFVEPERYICWYPPVTDAEWTEIRKANRQRLLSLVEKAYGISLADFPEELYVWKVAVFVKWKLLSR